MDGVKDGMDLLRIQSYSSQQKLNFGEEILSNGIYVQDEDGDTLLHLAIILCRTNLIMQLISEAPSCTFLSLKNSLHQTPLHLATLTNQPEVVRRLMVAGAVIQSRDKDGNTAMHLACRDGHTEIVNILLETVTSQDKRSGKQQIPQIMSVLNYEGLSCLHLAAMNGHLNTVKALVRKDIDINVKDGKTGRTILHHACLSGDTTLVMHLLGYMSCDINARAYDESTPFDIARACAKADICTVLAAAGARYSWEYFDSE